MKILIACEESGRVREAFNAKGHDAWSCDLQDTEIPGQHIIGDVRDYLNCGWDAMIAFPPCTHLCSSGARWFSEKKQEQADAIAFFMLLYNAPIPRIAIENPVGIMSKLLRKPDQIIHPWQFGHDETKKTCLWLKGFPPLEPTHIIMTERFERIWKMGKKDRAKMRSRTYTGIALQMVLL